MGAATAAAMWDPLMTAIVHNEPYILCLCVVSCNVFLPPSSVPENSYGNKAIMQTAKGPSILTYVHLPNSELHGSVINSLGFRHIHW